MRYRVGTACVTLALALGLSGLCLEGCALLRPKSGSSDREGANATGMTGTERWMNEPVPACDAAPTASGRKPAARAVLASTSPADTLRRGVVQRFEAELSRHRNLDAAGLFEELSVEEPSERQLGFDPAEVAYYDLVAKRLALSAAERDTYRRRGLTAVVRQGQRFSMTEAYEAIYARDLPVLITTDSMLYALHTAYSTILSGLESGTVSSLLGQALTLTSERLERQAPGWSGRLSESAHDVQVYLDVAESLLLGAGAGGEVDVATSPSGPAEPTAEPFPLVPGAEDEVGELLRRIAKVELESPRSGAPNPTPLRGGKRYVDWSHFQPRGHYTESEELQGYFRAMMWLGRADTGFVIEPPDPRSGLEVDADRELRAAALLTLAIEGSGARPLLQAALDLIDLFVGRSDSLGLGATFAALRAAKISEPAQLGSTQALTALRAALARQPGLAVNSQVLISPRHEPRAVRPPKVWQLFGQRFTPDSFLLSKVVYDTILWKGNKEERMMPQGLDVMAALGSDEALRLLGPEVERWHYGANLLAARRAVEGVSRAEWSESVQGIWLDALRTLSVEPEGAFPEAMRGTAWRRKQLQTQHASWAELRHDNALYTAQSYTPIDICEYPRGYVEPYPAFFARLAELAELVEAGLERMGCTLEAHQKLQTGGAADGDAPWRERDRAYLRYFARISRNLESLARKELASEPFSERDIAFLKRPVRAVGSCAPPAYDGWYVQLLAFEKHGWKPGVADVHTDPDATRVLEAGVGDAELLVVAVDNDGDRAAYVGPIYTYHEFTQPAADRLTDERWRELLHGPKPPARPAWIRPFSPPAAPGRLAIGAGAVTEAMKREESKSASERQQWQQKIDRKLEREGKFRPRRREGAP